MSFNITSVLIHLHPSNASIRKTVWLVSFILHTLSIELQTETKTEAESKYPAPRLNYSSAVWLLALLPRLNRKVTFLSVSEEYLY